MDIQLLISFTTLIVSVFTLCLVYENRQLLKQPKCQHDWDKIKTESIWRQYHRGDGRPMNVADLHTLKCKHCGDIKGVKVSIDD